MTTPRTWKVEDIDRASQMWMSGMKKVDIVNALGDWCTMGMLSGIFKRNRDKFPVREGDARYKRHSADINEIARLWNDTKMSSTTIGRKFGLSSTTIRSMVAYHKDLFISRKKGAPKSPKPVPAKKEGRDVFIAPKISTIEFKHPELDDYERARLPGVNMIDNFGCRYPLTEDGPHMFCGCKRVEMKSYCAYHVEKVAGPGTRSERRAVRDARRVA